MSVQAGTLPVNQQLFGQQAPGQTPFGVQTPYQQGYFAQAPIGAQTQQVQGLMPQIQGQIGQQQWMAAAPIVSEVTLRVVSAALATITEQVRADPQALQMLIAQGQLTPQAYANVLVESARRCAPIVASTIGALTPGVGHQIAATAFANQQYGQANGVYGQQQAQPWAQQAQVGQQAQIGQQTQFGQQYGQQYGWQAPYGQTFGAGHGSPISQFG